MNNDIEKAKEMLVYIIENNTLMGFKNSERQELAQTILLELDTKETTIKELQEMKKEILTDDLDKKYNIYRDSKIKELEKERDYYKKMYLEFNEGIVAGMKVIEERDKRIY